MTVTQARRTACLLTLASITNDRAMLQNAMAGDVLTRDAEDIVEALMGLAHAAAIDARGSPEAAIEWLQGLLATLAVAS